MQPHRGGYSNNGAPGQGYGERATGNVKALFIGINYVGQNGQLRGCVNDVKTIQKVLKAKGICNGSYQEVVLVDEQKGEFRGAKHPTKKEILQSFKWLSSNNRPGDTLFLHYSGHGGQQRDHDGDEQDGYDETICPVDYASAGQITDDEIYKILVTPLPSGVRMTAIMDCCHSGTAMDLPFEFKADGGSMRSALSDPGSMAMYGIGRGKKMKKEKKAKKEKKGKKEKKEKKEKKDKKDKKNKYYDDDDDDDDDAPLTHHSMAGNSDGQGADVIMFSGCADSQTSADVSGPQGAGGACTNSFSAVLLGQSNLRFVDLLEQMRQDLKKKRYTQIPQLSSTKPVDLNAVFSFFGPISKSRAAPRDAPPSYDYQPPVPVFLQGIVAPYAQQGAYPPPQGAPNQFPPQGQYPPQGPPQGQHPPHGQYPAQGPPQGQYPPQGPPQGQYPPHGQYPPQGPPQGQHPPHGQYPPQGAPGQYPPHGQYPPGPGNHHMLPHGQTSNESV